MNEWMNEWMNELMNEWMDSIYTKLVYKSVQTHQKIKMYGFLLSVKHKESKFSSFT